MGYDPIAYILTQIEVLMERTFWVEINDDSIKVFEWLNYTTMFDEIDVVIWCIITAHKKTGRNTRNVKT